MKLVMKSKQYINLERLIFYQMYFLCFKFTCVIFNLAFAEVHDTSLHCLFPGIFHQSSIGKLSIEGIPLQRENREKCRIISDRKKRHGL